jgi:hypothetical protein
MYNQNNPALFANIYHTQNGSSYLYVYDAAANMSRISVGSIKNGVDVSNARFEGDNLVFDNGRINAITNVEPAMLIKTKTNSYYAVTNSGENASMLYGASDNPLPLFNYGAVNEGTSFMATLSDGRQWHSSPVTDISVPYEGITEPHIGNAPYQNYNSQLSDNIEASVSNVKSTYESSVFTTPSEPQVRFATGNQHAKDDSVVANTDYVVNHYVYSEPYALASKLKTFMILSDKLTNRDIYFDEDYPNGAQIGQCVLNNGHMTINTPDNMQIAKSFDDVSLAAGQYSDTVIIDNNMYTILTEANNSDHMTVTGGNYGYSQFVTDGHDLQELSNRIMKPKFTDKFKSDEKLQESLSKSVPRRIVPTEFQDVADAYDHSYNQSQGSEYY